MDELRAPGLTPLRVRVAGYTLAGLVFLGGWGWSMARMVPYGMSARQPLEVPAQTVISLPIAGWYAVQPDLPDPPSAERERDERDRAPYATPTPLPVRLTVRDPASGQSISVGPRPFFGRPSAGDASHDNGRPSPWGWQFAVDRAGPYEVRTELSGDPAEPSLRLFLQPDPSALMPELMGSWLVSYAVGLGLAVATSALAVRRQRVTPTERATRRGTVASRWARWDAWLVDVSLWAVPYLLAGRMMIDSDTGNEILATVATGWGGLFLYVALQVVLLARRAQTFGKVMDGIQIVRADTGQPAGFFRTVFLRYLVNFVLCYVPPLIYLYVDLLWVFRPARRCLHDHLAGTTVVYV
jgi:uncharacterized RDD family membrane protein YckC